jgi:hypothetical protein
MESTMSNRNPFRCQESDWRREAFFNRDTDVRKVLSKLRRCQSVSVFGQGKIGKTWFLHQISDSEVTAQHGLALQKHCIAYIDCRDQANLNEEGWWGCIRAAVQEVVLARDVSHIPVLEGAGCSDAHYWLNQTLSRFDRVGVQLTVQLDNFDCLAKSDRLSLELLDNLRALSEAQDVMSYVTASKDSLVDLQNELPLIMGSPFFDIFWDHELRPFSRDDTLRFLTDSLEPEGVHCLQSVLECLASLSRGEPGLLQLACACAYDVWEDKGRISLSDEDCGEVEKRFKCDLHSLSSAAK